MVDEKELNVLAIGNVDAPYAVAWALPLPMIMTEAFSENQESATMSLSSRILLGSSKFLKHFQHRPEILQEISVPLRPIRNA